MTHRVIFLDIDGVLAPWSTCELDRACVARLDRLVRRTKAQVVISSSWREHTPLADIAGALEAHGLTPQPLAATPVRPQCTRGEEILAWLEGRSPAFVVLDDVPVRELGDRQVRTDEERGISDEDCARAERLLMDDRSAESGQPQ